MPQRELMTIGALRAQPLGRARARLRAVHGMGSATVATASDALSTASLDLLNYLDSHGVPSEHDSDPQVLAYQKAWNADPANVSDQLTPDGGYGPLTQGTLNVLTGGIAPAVNTGPPGNVPAPTPVAPPVPVTPPAPIKPAADTGGEVGFWLLVAALGVGAYFLLRKKKGKTVHHHHPASAAIELRSNPRRRGRRRRNGAELIP